MKIHFLLLAFLLLAFNSFGQSLSISGVVVDKVTNDQLPGAVITVVKLPDSIKIYERTNNQGSFKFSNLAPADYYVIVKILGYKPYTKNVSLISNLYLGNIELVVQSKNLKEVTITENAIIATQKGDTTELNADAFKVNKDANAEDLVTKMPGVTLQDGKIQAQGEDVKKVLIDGKPYFGTDPNAALKNLPADVVDKVQIFDQQNDQSRFSGFNDGNTEKTMNIVTRINMRNGQFGRLQVGYGTRDTYKLSGSYNNFKNSRRITLLAQTNNINEQNFSSEDLVGISGGGGGGRGSGRGGFRYGGGNSDFMSNQQNGISITNALGINYSDVWGKKDKIEVSGSYFFNYSDNSTLQKIGRSYFLGALSDQFYTENNIADAQNSNQRMNFRFQYKIDTVNELIITPRFSYQNNSSASLLSGFTTLNDIALSQTNTSNNNDRNGYSASTGITFRHKLKKQGRTFTLDASPSISTNTSNSGLISSNSFFKTGNIVTDSLNQIGDNQNNGWGLNTNLLYTEPINNVSQLQFSYGYNINNNFNDKSTYNFNDVTQVFDSLDSLLSNNFSSDYTTQKAGLGYRYFKAKLQINFMASYQIADLLNNQTFPYSSTFNRRFNNLLPSAMLQYNISKTKNIRLNYRTNTNQPSINQLQEIVNNSNPLQLTIGNENLDQQMQHNVFLRYSAQLNGGQNMFFGFIGGSATQKYIAGSTFLAQADTVIKGVSLNRGSQLSTYENLDGNYSLRSFVTYSFPLGFIKSKFSVNWFNSFSRTPGIINENINYSLTPTSRLGAVLSSNISQNIDFTLSSNLAYNTVINTIQNDLNQEFLNLTNGVKFNFTLWKGIVLTTDLNHNYYSGLADGFNQNFILWNAGLGKKIFKNQMGEIRLYAFDLLKQNNSVARNTYDTYLEDTQTNVLQQYFMVNFIYNLRKFGAGMSNPPAGPERIHGGR